MFISSELSNCEQELLTNLLREDAGAASSEFTSGIRLSWLQVGRAFTDWRIYLYVAIGFCNFGVNIFLTTYIPLLAQNVGQPTVFIHLKIAPFYAIACIFCLLVGYSSSRRQEISFHLIFCQLVTVLGFILLIIFFDRGETAVFASICVICCGAFSACPLILSWITKNIGGHTKRTIAIGLALCIGQAPGMFASQVRCLLLKTFRIMYRITRSHAIAR